MTKRDGSPTEPISEKDVHQASAADVEGDAPVSGSVNEGDDVVRRNDVEGTLGPVAEVPPPFLSEGVRSDIELYGSTVDPVTGRRMTRDDLPK